VASEALQIFLRQRPSRVIIPIEKILRRCTGILDRGTACNEVLAIKGGYYLIDS